MERRGVVVGVLAMLSVALAAGALSAPAPSTSAGGGVTVGGGSASGWGVGGVLWLLVLAAVVVGGAALLVAQVRAGGGREPLSRRFVALVLAVGAFVAGALLVALRAVGGGDGPRRQEGLGGPLVQGAPEAGASSSAPGPGGVLAILAVVAALVVAYAAYRWYSSDGADDGGDGDDAPHVEDDAPVDEDALGAAAGRAAESLDGAGAPADNEVVRAWRSLAAVLPVSRPASSTPREFAAAATAAGVDERDVEELTALFEAVRYGDRPADGERARRAVAALERIRAEHGDGSDEVGAGHTDVERDESDMVGERDAEGSS